MSRHWDPHSLQGTARGRPRHPRAWNARAGRRNRRKIRFAATDLLIMMTAGLAVGILIAWVSSQIADPVPVEAPAPATPGQAIPDPYAEARRSRAILDAQQGPPPRQAVPEFGAEATRVASPASVRVIDGDTLHHGGWKIRIVGLDTPEVSSPRCAYEARLGALATDRLRQWVGLGPFDLVPIDRDEDRYGRKLRIVKRGGEDVADLLIAEGLARPYQGGRRAGWCA